MFIIVKKRNQSIQKYHPKKYRPCVISNFEERRIRGNGKCSDRICLLRMNVKNFLIDF